MQTVKVNICDRDHRGDPVFPATATYELEPTNAQVTERFASQAGEPEGRKVDAFFIFKDTDIKKAGLTGQDKSVVFEYEGNKYMMISHIKQKGFYGSCGTYEFKCYKIVSTT